MIKQNDTKLNEMSTRPSSLENTPIHGLEICRVSSPYQLVHLPSQEKEQLQRGDFLWFDGTIGVKKKTIFWTHIFYQPTEVL